MKYKFDYGNQNTFFSCGTMTHELKYIAPKQSFYFRLQM